MRTYEDHVLGKLHADTSFERAGDAVRRYQGRDRTRGLAFIVRQVMRRADLSGVHFNPAVLKSLRTRSPEEVGRFARSSSPKPASRRLFN